MDKKGLKTYSTVLDETAKTHYNNFISLSSLVLLLKSQDKNTEEIISYIQEINDIWGISFKDYMGNMSLLMSKIDPDFDKEDFQHIIKQFIDKSISITKAESFSMIVNMLKNIIGNKNGNTTI